MAFYGFPIEMTRKEFSYVVSNTNPGNSVRSGTFSQNGTIVSGFDGTQN